MAVIAEIRIRGLGVGGVGISELHANGDVYGLSRIADFPGLFGAARAGAVANTTQVRGGVWLQNPVGVSIHLHPQRSGVALQVGADGLLIELDKRSAEASAWWRKPSEAPAHAGGVPAPARAARPPRGPTG